MCLHKMLVILVFVAFQFVIVSFAKTGDTNDVLMRQISEMNLNRTNLLAEIVGIPKQFNFDIDEARGKKRRKKRPKTKKHMKKMIPILIGALATKALLLPIFLKALAFLSSSSFILSNLSILLSMLIGIKLMVHNISKRSEPPKVEVHHVETTPVVHENNSWKEEWDRRYNIIPVTNEFLNNQTNFSYPNYPYLR